MRVVVVGAGMGGLAAAADLARAGTEVLLLEKEATVGGKMRRVLGVDAGPTVFTMRWIFDGLFGDAGQRLEDHLTLEPSEILARHAWRDGGRLDLFADVQRSADAIGSFAGAADARGYLDFCARAADMYRTLRPSFIAAQRPSPLRLTRNVGLTNLDALWRTAPWATLWGALGRHFRDPRLRQLFGRYATYVGSSPMLAPATLMLIAHVEQDGVWLVRGGIGHVALAMRALAESQGARVRCGAAVEEIVVERGRAAGVRLAGGERIAADAVVFNGDAGALAAGLLGGGAKPAVKAAPREARSLSAVTWCVHARATGFPLVHHNVFFGNDYADEFDAIFRRREVCATPTVYLCAQDRPARAAPSPEGAERMLLLVNAPPDGDRSALPAEAVAARMASLLGACGLALSFEQQQATTPQGFDALFPGTGGALYGRASHGSMASFARPGSRSKLPGLYLAGGSVHPGAGVPMATMSGRLAAARLLEDAGAFSRAAGSPLPAPADPAPEPTR